MQLREHITRLEQKIDVLEQQLRYDGLPADQIAEREVELSNAAEALRLFRKSYELEQRIQTLNDAHLLTGV